jgi:2-hydroxy-3-keto-5-methylthiopentenyl-1-phosphate phosphatase
MEDGFTRKEKEEKPVVAICYDFDKTLSPDDMQAQGFIQSVGYDIETFWKRSNKLATDNGMDQNLAYMYTMLEASIGKKPVTKEVLKAYGSKIELFPGVEDWFARIRRFGDGHNIIIEHYIISSGLKEMIEGTSVAGEFERIYASSFYFDESNFARWPAQAVNYTNKTQFLFRIEKGVLDINDQGVNDSFPANKIRVPFRNMVYIGDSDTDIPCMKLVNLNGGHSIGVYNNETKDKTKVNKMMRENRIRYFSAADYTENSELDNLIKSIIIRTEANEKIEEMHIANQIEQIDNDEKNELQIHNTEKPNAIVALGSSQSFANTHMVISKINQIVDWTSSEIELLFKIGNSNSQVRYIMSDSDVKSFYRTLLGFDQCDNTTDNAKDIISLLK